MNALGELNAIITKQDIVNALKTNGVKEDAVLEVHVALSSFGYVVGGAQTIIDALIDVVGYNGTILMTMNDLFNSEPTYWKVPSMVYDDIKKIRKHIPAFDKKNSDSYDSGSVVENLRRRTGVVISNHPTYSYIAWGKYAKFLCNRHSLHLSQSIESPLGRISELRGHVLLMGVDYSYCSLFHLAQEITKCETIEVNGAAIEVDGQRIWKKYLNTHYNNKAFNAIGEQLESKQLVKKFNIMGTPCRLLKVSLAINEAISYYHEHSILKYYKLG